MLPAPAPALSAREHGTLPRLSISPTVCTDADRKVHMDNLVPMTSRRALLGAFGTVPATAIAAPAQNALAGLWKAHDDEPVTLLRTREGRSLSLHRYRTAKAFFPELDHRSLGSRKDFLYRAGITAQLGLASHLLDVGFPDPWVARHIGLRVAKSLAYANATGFGHACPNMSRLADVLSPYWKWNRPRLFGEPAPDDGGFSPEEVRILLHKLLSQVTQVTGHGVTRGR